MSAKSTNIKNRIKTILDGLVTSNVLGAVVLMTYKTDPFNYDVSAYPAAFLSPPAMAADAETNRDNMRTYSFGITVLMRTEDTDKVEDVQEAIMDALDNDPTLGGYADGGSLPAISQPEPVTTAGGDMQMFVVGVQAKALKTLT